MKKLLLISAISLFIVSFGAYATSAYNGYYYDYTPVSYYDYNYYPPAPQTVNPITRGQFFELVAKMMRTTAYAICGSDCGSTAIIDNSQADQIVNQVVAGTPTTMSYYYTYAPYGSNYYGQNYNGANYNGYQPYYDYAVQNNWYQYPQVSYNGGVPSGYIGY